MTQNEGVHDLAYLARDEGRERSSLRVERGVDPTLDWRAEFSYWDRNDLVRTIIVLEGWLQPDV